jgi:hypothetical protein
MPFEFLGKNEADIEGVAHDHVDKYDDHDNRRGPGHDMSHPGIERINPATKCFDQSHSIFFR